MRVPLTGLLALLFLSSFGLYLLNASVSESTVSVFVIDGSSQNTGINEARVHALLQSFQRQGFNVLQSPDSASHIVIRVNDIERAISRIKEFPEATALVDCDVEITNRTLHLLHSFSSVVLCSDVQKSQLNKSLPQSTHVYVLSPTYNTTDEFSKNGEIAIIGEIDLEGTRVSTIQDVKSVGPLRGAVLAERPSPPAWILMAKGIPFVLTPEASIWLPGMFPVCETQKCVDQELNSKRTGLELVQSKFTQRNFDDVVAQIASRSPPTPKVYLTSALINVEAIWPDLEKALLELVEHIGARNAFFSILSNGNKDNTEALLVKFGSKLEKMNIPHLISFESAMPREEYHTNRIKYLAELRNEVLEPLTADFDKVVFFNDILVTGQDLVKLYDTPVDYDMVCAMDFSFSDFTLLANNKVEYGRRKELKFYDAWVARDLDGSLMLSDEPWVKRPDDLKAVDTGSPFQVYSCWNGVVVFRSEPLFRHKINFRASDSTEPFSSECLQFSKDLWSSGYNKIYINPVVHVAYEHAIYKKLMKSSYHKRISQIQSVEVMQPLQTEMPPYTAYCDTFGLEKYDVWTHCRMYPNRHNLTLGIFGSFLANNEVSRQNRLMKDALSEFDPYCISNDDLSSHVIEMPGVVFDIRKVDIGIFSSFPPDFQAMDAARYKILWLHYGYAELGKWVSLLPEFDRIWVHSYFQLERLSEHVDPSRIQIVGPFIQEDYFTAPRTSSDSVRFLFVGKGDWTSGLDLALPALKKQKVTYLLESAPVDFNIDWVDLTKLTEAERLALMAEHDVVVSPVRVSHIQVPVIEALALGLPLVGPDTGYYNEFAFKNGSFLLRSRIGKHRSKQVVECKKSDVKRAVKDVLKYQEDLEKKSGYVRNDMKVLFGESNIPRIIRVLMQHIFESQ